MAELKAIKFSLISVHDPAPINLNRKTKNTFVNINVGRLIPH